MAELPEVFAADDSQERQGVFDLMPVDDLYLGHIKKSEIKKTKAKTGLRLNMQVEIDESRDAGDKYKGRLVFIGLNIKNPSNQCEAISKKELASICDAVGVEEIEDSEELHETSFGFKLKIEVDADGMYDDKNVIKQYITEADYDEAVKAGK